jgi:hypothetical protein
LRDRIRLLGLWPSYPWIAATPTISWKRLQKILRQAWHGCNIPPGNEQICTFCHATVENDGVAGSVGHIVKL